MKNKIKAVIFDVDGVLIRGQDENGEFLWQKNVERDLAIKKDAIPKLFKEYWPLIGTGQLDTVQAVQQFLNSIESKVTAIDFINYWHKNDSNLDNSMLNAAKELNKKGYELYLGTNQEKYRAKYMWEELGFNKVFKDIFASCFIGAEKPNIEYFERVQAKLNLSSAQILFLDDHEKNVESAKQQGWNAIRHFDFNDTKEKVFSFL